MKVYFIHQTLALFRYQMLGMINTRILVLLSMILAAVFLGSRFIAELAIIHSEDIALAAMADMLRYSLVILLIISISYQISQDYELSQFERILAMPVSRVQYVLAQSLVLLVIAFVFCLPVFLLMVLINDVSNAFYWSLALYLEMILIGQFAVLAIISLEKLPIAVMFTLGVYLLAKASPLIDLIIAQTQVYYIEEQGVQFSSYVFSAIQHVLPDASAFAQNDALFGSIDKSDILVQQCISVLVYGMFIQLVILLDFYRKEFNRT